MKTNKTNLFSLVVLALVLTVSGTAADLILKWRAGMDAAGAEYRIGERYPMPTQEVPFGSFLGSGTATIGTATAVICPTLPANTRTVLVGATGGALNFGNASVPLGTYPFNVAENTFREFNVTTTTPVIYFRGATATCTAYWLAK